MPYSTESYEEPKHPLSTQHLGVYFKKLKFVLVTIAGVFFGGAFLFAESASDALAAYGVSLKQKFPEVVELTPDQLARLDPPPLLLDVREEKEFAVSHLRGALRAEKDAIAQLLRLGVGKDTPIVVYCSVGFRSSVLAGKLREAGFVNIKNLEGSIFAWANSGRPLVNARGSTDGVHPFNVLWGRCLEKARWRWEPETQP